MEVPAGNFHASLEGAIRDAIHSVGVPELARRMGLPEGLLYRVCYEPDNPSGQHRPLPASLIVPLFKATGRLDIVAWLAREAGCVLVPIPEATPTPASLVQRLGALAREFGEANTAAAAALDGVTKAEKVQLGRELRDLITEASGLLLSVEGAA